MSITLELIHTYQPTHHRPLHILARDKHFDGEQNSNPSHRECFIFQHLCFFFLEKQQGGVCGRVGLHPEDVCSHYCFSYT